MIENSGIGVYLKYYINYLARSERFKILLLGNLRKLNKYFQVEENLTIKKLDIPIYSLKEQLYLPFVIPRCDIFWSPHYNIPILPIKSNKRVVTIPDAAHLAVSKLMGFSIIQKIYANIVFRAAVFLSDVVLTISHFSKREILKYAAVDSNKIKVIYLGIDSKINNAVLPIEKEEVFKKYALPQKYILFVGNVKPHKNLISLIKSYHRIRDKIKDYKILIVGKKEGFITGDNVIFKFIAKHELERDIHFTGFVDDLHLPIIYQSAQLFVFPSKYEGFGFPPLEAMANNCPVVSSSNGSLPEICGDAVKFFTEEGDLDDAILDVINDRDLRKELIGKGEIHWRKFSWKKSGESFIKLLVE